MRSTSFLLAVFGLLFGSAVFAADTYAVGVAKVDITPTYPVRLSGFGFRLTESEGVTQRIWAKALAIGDDEPAVLITADNLGVPLTLTREIAKRLEAKGVKADRLVITATHTHTAPMLTKVCPTLFGVPIPKEHQEHIDRYTKEFTDRLEQVALAALADRKPARLSWGIGSVGFAVNRRTKGGPVDHDLPVLVVRDLTGKVRAVYLSYACHCVTLSNNKVSGDWAGFAQQLVEDDLPGAVVLCSVGCGADSNPSSGVTGDKAEIAQRQGAEIATEVKRLLKGTLAPVAGPLTAASRTVDLPLADLPARDVWEAKAKRTDAVGHYARVQLARLDRGEPLRTKIAYPVVTWSFGDALAMVFLPGEVVVDYSQRLKRELDRSKLWLNAYSNDSPGYVPSERVLQEGGYEGGAAMVYYDIPGPYKAGLEDKVVSAVRDLLDKRFSSPVDPEKTGGVRPLSPRQSLAALVTGKGLAVDLVAAEPLVTSPVAIDFGPDGRLWVAEMYDYPSGVDGKFGPGGRGRILESTRGDGVYDKATIFLDKIPFPTGITVWRGGVLVCAAPDVLYAEDTKRDGKADVVTKLYSGFGVDNYQARVNSLCYGLDGWVYGSCGLFGGRIKSHRTGKEFVLGDRDFRIKPDTGEIEAATGRTQQGRARDDWDDWFGCDNSDFCRHYILSDHYLRRNPHVLPPALAAHVPADAEADRLYLARPEIQLFKLSGPPGRATAACGLGVYRDDLLGKDLTGNVFTCEPVNLVVHRLQLSPKGYTFAGRRPADEARSEFLASTDNWFRPVQMRTGPDGAVWVVDMYRYVIEHPRWIPPEDLAKLDVRAGSTMGRIYRVRPADKPLRPVARLDALDAAGLVAALDTPNGTVRDLAGQMLLWRDDTSAAPALEKLLRESPRPEARLQALCVLDGLGKLTPPLVLRGLRDRHPGVRRQAVRLAEPFLGRAPALEEPLARLVADTDAQVRLQVAYTLGSWRDARAGLNLAALLLAHGSDGHLVTAVLSSINADNVGEVLVGLFGIDGGKAAPPEAVQRVLAVAAALGDRATLARVVGQVTTPRDGRYSAAQVAALAGVLDALGRRGQGLEALTDGPAREKVTRLLALARLAAADEKTPLPERIASVQVLGREPKERANDVTLLGKLLAPQTPADLQSAALASLGRVPDEHVPAALLAGWKSHTPSLKTQILDLLLGRDAWQRALLASLEKGEVPAGHVDAARRQRLLTHKDEPTRARAAKVFAMTSADRQKVLQSYAGVAALKGDAVRGKAVFGKSCAPCHRLDDVGFAVGPDLAALANKSTPYLLQEILDPNRNVDTRYVEYSAETKAGRIVTGLLAAETSTSITLRGQEGKQQVLLRSEIETLSSAGKSLMPEGLEKDVGKQDMADLIAYMSSRATPPKSFPGNAPAVVRAVDGAYALLATNGAIHGDGIAFEEPFQNVGMWLGLADHVVWTLEVAKEGLYDVWLDWACDDGSAGNAFALEGTKSTLRGKVVGTGGWDKYRQERIGTLVVAAGAQRLTFRPDGVLRNALIDLRGVHLVPPGQKPTFAPPQALPATGPKAAARDLLEDTLPQDRRQALINAYPEWAADLVAAMTADLKPDPVEEYRRIPWVWRVAVAAGKRNDAGQLRRLLGVSLPKAGAPLRDWQAVVVGGGIINGVSQAGAWPRPRLEELVKDNEGLSRRWRQALEQASAMADDAKVPAGTRYDALRVIALDAWERRGAQLAKYLATGTNAELQQGAVSGLADMEAPEATAKLLASLEGLTPGNQALALDGLLRSEARATALVEGLEQGKVKRAWLGEKHVQALRAVKDESLRARALKALAL